MSPSRIVSYVLAPLLIASCGPRARSTGAEGPGQSWSGERKIEVGVRSLHLRCIGTGAPTIVLDADWNHSASEWSKVEPEIAKLSRVCSYDRPGLGQSDIDPIGPRSVQLLVYDLREILAQAGEAGPFILVGSSFSSYTARLFARQHPDLVAGLVLIGPAHMALEPEMLELLSNQQRQWWSSPPEVLEQIDFERSAAIMATPAPPPRVPAAVVASVPNIPTLGFPGEPPTAELGSAAARIEARVTSRLRASTSADVVTAIRAVMTAARN